MNFPGFRFSRMLHSVVRVNTYTSLYLATRQRSPNLFLTVTRSLAIFRPRSLSSATLAHRLHTPKR